jgi:hypothetical protein
LAAIRHVLSQTTSPNIFSPTRFWKDNFCPVRWKLLMITSLVAALVNAGGMRALAYWMTGSAASQAAPTGPHLLAFVSLIPLVFTALAAIFVYRHTARRRKLQAALTVIFTLVLTFAALFAARMFFRF